MSKKYLSKVNAAFEILKDYPEGLSYKEIIEISLRKKLIKTEGKTPEASLRSDVYSENRRRTNTEREIRFDNSVSGILKLKKRIN